METKKNPEHDLHRHSFKFQLAGLIISIAIVITVFEWKSIKEVKGTRTADVPQEAFIPVMNAVHEEKPLPAAPVIKKVDQTVSAVASTISETVAKHLQPADNPGLQPGSSGAFITLPPMEEDSTKIHVMAEVQPRPVGGYEAFYSLLSKNMKYPKQALRQGIEGTIFIEFVINKKGNVDQLKVIKGIGAGCDDEALRLLKLTSWEPGRQRGKPVHVRMIIPIKFKIRN
jgi:periplasmic protein TonB